MPDDSKRPENEAPSTVRWFQAILTAVLALLAAFQVIHLVPACDWVAGRLARDVPVPIRALLSIPPALLYVAALALAGMAFWQRHSAHRSVLLATLAVSANFAVLLCIFVSLFNSLQR